VVVVMVAAERFVCPWRVWGNDTMDCISFTLHAAFRSAYHT